MKIDQGRDASARERGKTDGGNSSYLDRSAIPRILCSARHAASHRHQHARPKVSPLRSRQPHGHLSGLHFQVRIWAIGQAAGLRHSGKLQIAEKIGDNAPPGTVFKDQRRTGEVVLANSPGRDPIVTRILWLRGLEAQNANAFCAEHLHPRHTRGMDNRKAASYGCVRMRSTDIIQLYNIVGIGAAVTIVNAPLVSAVPGMASGHSMGPENTAPFVMR